MHVHRQRAAPIHAQHAEGIAESQGVTDDRGRGCRKADRQTTRRQQDRNNTDPTGMQDQVIREAGSNHPA